MLLLCACFAFIAGCGSSPEPLVVVRGMVLVNGQPAAGARVTFHPAEGGKPVFEPAKTVAAGKITPPELSLMPWAIAEADGSFEVTTFEPYDGIPAGDYLVTVSWAPQISGGSEPEEGPDRLPPRFQDPKTSGLSVTVEPGETELPPLKIEVPNNSDNE
ncbi:MAG: hypothetical protein JSS02_31400 [Planctomycetes bacterium]|nr:hypothetical protein [Planctomycetota bacterium]